MCKTNLNDTSKYHLDFLFFKHCRADKTIREAVWDEEKDHGCTYLSFFKLNVIFLFFF